MPSPVSDRHLAALTSLGAVAPRMEVQEALDRLAGIPPSAIAEVLLRHKVVLRATARLRAARLDEATAASAERIAAGLARRHGALEGREAAMPGRIALVASLAERLERPVLLLKGAAAEELYERPSLRDPGDLDVYVDSVDAAWTLTLALFEHGYAFDPGEAPWIKRARDGVVYGQMRLSAPGGEPDIDIDIHFARLSIRHCATLALDVADAPGAVRTLTPAENLPLLVADAAGDYFVSTKLLNDLLLTLRARPDLAAPLAQLRAVCLERFFPAVCERLLAAEQVEPEVRRALSREERVAQERLPPVAEVAWRQRWLGTSAHAFRVGRRESLARGAWSAWTALRYYRRPLALRIARRRGAAVSTASASPETCVRLLPAEQLAEAFPDHARARARVSDAPEDGRWEAIPGTTTMRRLATPEGELVRVGDHVLTPTLWYALPAPLVRRAALVTAALRRTPVPTA